MKKSLFLILVLAGLSLLSLPLTCSFCPQTHLNPYQSTNLHPTAAPIQRTPCCPKIQMRLLCHLRGIRVYDSQSVEIVDASAFAQEGMYFAYDLASTETKRYAALLFFQQRKNYYHSRLKEFHHQQMKTGKNFHFLPFPPMGFLPAKLSLPKGQGRAAILRKIPNVKRQGCYRIAYLNNI